MVKKKVRKINKLKVIRFILIILTIIFLTFFISNKTNKKTIKPNKEPKEIRVTKQEDKLTLIMVGDNLIHDKIYNYANKNNAYDFKPIFEYIKPIISNYDLAYYNQETILGGSELGVSSYPAFNSPYEVGDAMIDTGFNLVSLATNHTMDKGEQAVLNSREYWNKQKDILAVGSYSNEEERNKIQIRKKNNIKYTILNYTYGTNGIKVPIEKYYLVNIWPVTGSNPNTDISYQNYKQQIKKDIEKVRDKTDLLIVAMHWGIEYQTTPNDYQIDAAKYLESQGVDIIIGTHPHVIQPVDYINNTLVIYSLGNFLSAHEVVNISNRVGLMTSIDIAKEKNKIKLSNLKNELLYTYYTKDYKDFKIIPFTKINENYLKNYKEVYEKHKNIITSLNKNIEVN